MSCFYSFELNSTAHTQRTVTKMNCSRNHYKYEAGRHFDRHILLLPVYFNPFQNAVTNVFAEKFETKYILTEHAICFSVIFIKSLIY